MDFKKLISHIESIDGPIDTPKAQEKAQPIRLDEDAELRVLAGVTPLTESLIAERAKNPYAIGMSAAMKKTGDKPPLKKSTITKGHEIAKSIEKNEAIDTRTIAAAQEYSKKNPPKKDAESDANAKKPYGYRGPDGSEADDEVTKFKAKAKAKKESIDSEAFKDKFSKMVEAAKPDFLDLDKDGNKKEPMKKAAKEAGKGEKKGGDKKGVTTAQKKLPPGLQKAIAAKKGKKTVKESVETKLSFREMMKLVVESGGQQQMDPLDATLFDWASRVAKNKLGEGMKAEIYAGLVYERMGGRFEMYDVLSESRKKKINEEVDPEDIKKLVLQYEQGDIDYAELKDKLDGLEHTDYSMRQGELGNPDMRDQMAWDGEKDDWNDEDENDDWEDDFRESLTVQTEVKKKLSESDKPVSELSVSTLKSYQDKAISGKDIWKNPKKSYLNRISGIGRSQEKIDKKQANEGSWDEDRQVYDRDAIAGAIEPIYNAYLQAEMSDNPRDYDKFERRYEPWLKIINKFFDTDRSVEKIADRLHYYQREPNVKSFLKWVFKNNPSSSMAGIRQEDFKDDEFEKNYRSWTAPNARLARADALARSSEAEKLFGPEEKSMIDKLYTEMENIYVNSGKKYKTFRFGKPKNAGKEFVTLSVKDAHRGDRLSAEAEAFDQKIKDLGGKKKVDPIKKAIVWVLPRFN